MSHWNDLFNEPVSEKHRDNVMNAAQKLLSENGERNGRASWSFLNTPLFNALSLGVMTVLMVFWAFSFKDSELQQNDAVAILVSEDYELLDEDIEMLDDFEIVERLDELEAENNI